MVKSVATTIGFCNTSVKLKSMEVFQEATSSLVVPSAPGRPGAAKSQPPESAIFYTCARDAIQAPARRQPGVICGGKCRQLPKVNPQAPAWALHATNSEGRSMPTRLYAGGAIRTR